jgi:hypothetical protein
MSIESQILVENVTLEAVDSTISFSEKKIGYGYNKIGDGLHTYVYSIDSFVGSIKLQGTLELYPGDSDWVDINNTALTVNGDSTLLGATSGNFTGNFLWIRAGYNLQGGEIGSIRYNY